ncbi:MAG TPA: hypothetical protein VK483_05250 [Chitinophagaceae bacterium]|nr:hypothetical protein [Chitinophagaceae bacterium]
MSDTFYDLFKALDDKTREPGFNKRDHEPDIPNEVKTFLGQLSLLKDVPYYYLVPGEKYLPKYKKDSGTGQNEPEECGALKFFWLDPVWVQCLLNGAVSVCEPADMLLLLSKAMEGNYAAEVFRMELIERFKKQLFGSYKPGEIEGEIIKRMKEKGMNVINLTDPAVPTNAQSNWRYTGFLFRSGLVSGWKGLEVQAWGIDSIDDKTPKRLLNLVRMETIAPDTLFCLCEGIITEVTITQPSENLHFGVGGDYDTGKFTVQKDNKTIDIPMRGDKKRRVLNINDGNGLVSMLKTPANKFTSAEFAIEMLSKPIKDTIELYWGK